jgi:transcriptional regulator with XRE-family HTH domain
METVGGLLRSHRGALGLTQEQMAPRFKVKQSTYNRWENDEGVPYPEYWEGIRVELGVTETRLGKALLASGAIRGERKKLRGP